MDNDNIKFRKMLTEDLNQVVALYDSERNSPTDKNKMITVYDEVKDNPDYYFLVGEKDNQIVSFAKIIINKDIFESCNPFITVWSVRVKKELRGNGIGTKMFNYIESIAKKINCQFICLLAEKENVNANIFYNKLGYSCENGYVKFLKI